MEFRNYITIFNYRFKNEIKIPFYFFVFAILFTLSVFLFSILRNYEVFNPFGSKSPDFIFVFYVLSIILGSIAIYKLVRYYFEFHAIDYLLVAIFVFGTVVSLFLWQIASEYVWSDIWNLADITEWVRLTDPEVIVGRQIYFIGVLILLIYAVRLRDWSNYNKFWKFIIVISVLNSILHIIQDLVAHILMTLDVYNIIHVFTPIDYMTIYPYLTIAGVAKFIIRDLLVLNLQPGNWGGIWQLLDPMFISYYFLICLLIRTPISGKSKTVRISKIFWIGFGLLQIILTSIRIFIVGADGQHWHQFFSVIQIFFLIGFIIMLYYAPEVILISDEALFRARKLYEVIGKEKPSPEQVSNSSLSQSTNFGVRLKAYIESMPSDVLEEFKKKNIKIG